MLWTYDGITQRQLSQEVGVMEPTTFSAVRTLESLGVVERRRLDGNRKNNYVYLTKKGHGLQQKLLPLAEVVNSVSVHGIPEEDIATISRVLRAIIGNLAQDESESNKRFSSNSVAKRIRPTPEQWINDHHGV